MTVFEDRLRERWPTTASHALGNVRLSVKERDALADAIEALRAFSAHVQLNGGCRQGCPEHETTDAALARLDAA